MRKHQAIPDTQVKVCDLADDIMKGADIEAMKSFYGASNISFRLVRVLYLFATEDSLIRRLDFRRFDGAGVPIKDLSDCLKSLGFSCLEIPGTLIHDKVGVPCC